MLTGKRILLGISGGIAAYKGPMVVRALIKAGAEVRVVITRGAAQFVTPMALQAVSHHPVGQDLFDPAYEDQIGHIELARWPDAILVAPTTAHMLAKMAHGLCDDLLTTVLTATRAPVILAPAMNTQMFRHPAVEANMALLERREGYHLLAPDSGELACQETGPGRMPDPEDLVEAVERALTPQTMTNTRVLVTAGPTREALDPVRFLSNPSSGKMGFAIARAAARQGATVTLVTGPVHLPTPKGVERVDVVSADDMHRAVTSRARHMDVIVKAAAVADWRPAHSAEHKMKKTPGEMSIPMTRTQDILAGLGAMDDEVRPTLVGFAAETRDLTQYAQDKLTRKNLDMIVANQVRGPQSAFGADQSSVIFLDRRREPTPFGPASKDAIADALWRHVGSLPTRDERSPRSQED